MAIRKRLIPPNTKRLAYHLKWGSFKNPPFDPTNVSMPDPWPNGSLCITPFMVGKLRGKEAILGWAVPICLNETRDGLMYSVFVATKVGTVGRFKFEGLNPHKDYKYLGQASVFGNVFSMLKDAFEDLHGAYFVEPK